jgi:hypothetical protein
MDEDPRKWSNQYYSNLGGKEFLRSGCAIGLWFLLGFVLGDIFYSKLLLFVFIAILFIYSVLAPIWTPMYLIHRKILGNPNLPTKPIPRRRMKVPRLAGQPILWIYQVPAILMAMMKLLISLLVMYFIIRYVLR